MTRHRRVATVMLVLVVGVLASALVAGVATAEQTDESPAQVASPDTVPSAIDSCAAEPPEDFADPDGGTSDVIGWVDGYWYDEPLGFDVTGELNETELEQLSARTAARVEAMRCLPVKDESVVQEVSIVDRETFADEQADIFVGTDEQARLADNAMFETLLLIDSQTDSVEVRLGDTSERVGGYYDYLAGELVIISDDPESLTIEEQILAHELNHAIQDQHFNLSQYDRTTTDRDLGKLGLIEGDVTLIEQEYQQACEAGEWVEECLSQDHQPDLDVENWGLFMMDLQPYSDGSVFAYDIREEEGWEGIDALYEDPPTSALHTVYPETYGSVDPESLDVPDRSTDEWERVVVDTPLADEAVDHDTLGVTPITAMFAEPALESRGAVQILSLQDLMEYGPFGEKDNYAHPENEGWRGDELHTYVNDENETATRWELQWATAEDAQPFVESYEELVDIRGGDPVEGYSHTYEFDEETGYEMAVTIVPDGDRVTIATAPSVEALTEVDTDIELLTEDNGEDDADDTDADIADDADDDGAGFGIIVGVAAILTATSGVLARRVVQ